MRLSSAAIIKYSFKSTPQPEKNMEKAHKNISCVALRALKVPSLVCVNGYCILLHLCGCNGNPTERELWFESF